MSNIDLSKHINKVHLSSINEYHLYCEEKNDAIKYLVLDNFFTDNYAQQLFQSLIVSNYQKDNLGLNYDSRCKEIINQYDDEKITNIFFSEQWRKFTSFIVDCNLQTDKSIFKYRLHPPNSDGFWVHTDISAESPKSMVILGYFNKNWLPPDGGVLQLWKGFKINSKSVKYKWNNYKNKKLSFLDTDDPLLIEASAPGGLLPLKMVKTQEIEPIYNRVVIINFQNNLAFHSVTPNNKGRYSIMQWLY